MRSSDVMQSKQAPIAQPLNKSRREQGKVNREYKNNEINNEIARVAEKLSYGSNLVKACGVTTQHLASARAKT